LTGWPWCWCSISTVLASEADCSAPIDYFYNYFAYVVYWPAKPDADVKYLFDSESVCSASTKIFLKLNVVYWPAGPDSYAQCLLASEVDCSASIDYF
jgi:hypothetical protein